MSLASDSERLGQSLQVHLDELWQQGPPLVFETFGRHRYCLRLTSQDTECEMDEKVPAAVAARRTGIALLW